MKNSCNCQMTDKLQLFFVLYAGYDVSGKAVFNC